jgi:MFS family permease
MSDRYGWRSAFLIQIPILFISFFLVWRYVHIPMAKTDQSFRTKIGRIDFLGSATLVSTVSCLLVSLTLKTSGDSELAWSDPIVWGLLVASAVFGIAFILVEKYVANEPIMPLRLVTQRTPAFVAISNFLISVLAFSVVSEQEGYRRRRTFTCGVTDVFWLDYSSTTFLYGSLQLSASHLVSLEVISFLIL